MPVAITAMATFETGCNYRIGVITIIKLERKNA
jgi:hypothetical protein